MPQGKHRGSTASAVPGQKPALLSSIRNGPGYWVSDVEPILTGLIPKRAIEIIVHCEV